MNDYGLFYASARSAQPLRYDRAPRYEELADLRDRQMGAAGLQTLPRFREPGRPTILQLGGSLICLPEGVALRPPLFRSQTRNEAATPRQNRGRPASPSMVASWAIGAPDWAAAARLYGAGYWRHARPVPRRGLACMAEGALQTCRSGGRRAVLFQCRARLPPWPRRLLSCCYGQVLISRSETFRLLRS